ncbi:MAG TPA: MMPL family transporter [Solirubrobacteraceae bacterium]|nr:MMPL family transporter [Solirubrobacteraceae bacterium]
MISLAKLSIRRPKSSLAVWLIIAIALSLVGVGVSKTLSPPITVVPGTQSWRAQQLGNAQFGPTQLVPILLEGPKAQLNRQGPPLVAALARRPHTRVLSAWDAGTASAGLRPKPDAAMIVVSVDRSEAGAVKYDQPQIENLVSHGITAPVRSYITGQPSIDRAEKNASLSNLRRDEMIAIAILLGLLLIGLRAPVAALVVTATAALSTLAGFGEVALLGHVLKLDPVGVAAGTMTGLAVAVAFALMILDRFHREELPEGSHPRTAAEAAVRDLESTGRAVLIAGTALVLALALVAVVGPTELMVSVGTGALTCAAFATGGAVVVMPAALVLLGRRIDAFTFPAPPPLARAWAALVDGGNRVVRHAVYAGFAATALLAAVAVPAFALKTGPPDVSQLPPHSQARIAFEEVSRVMGPGWATPYNLIVVANNRPITTPALLGSLYRFEEKIARNPTVASVTGPGQINSTSQQLASFGPQLNHSMKISDQSKSQLRQLIDGLGQAGAGSAQLQSGLASASTGASQLHSGSGQAQTGAGQLHSGLAQAQTGSSQLEAGLNQALSGANSLKKGAGQALSGANQLSSGLGTGAPQMKAGLPAFGTLASSSAATASEITTLQGQAQTAQNSASAALSALQGMSGASGDPGYQTAVSNLSNASATMNDIIAALKTAAGNASTASLLAASVKGQAGTLSAQLTAAASGAAQLASGIKQLRAGNAQLASGISQLATGGGQLNTGLKQLTAGAGALQIGLGQLTGGAGQLATGLATGVGPAGQLTTGLGTMQAAVIKSRGQIPSTAQLKQLEAQSPGIFNSGYFVLAAVEGATQSNRNAATFTINLLRGGTAGQIMVVSKYRANDPRTAALRTQLATDAQHLAKASNVRVAVGGPAGNLGDLTSVTRSRIWIDVAVVSAAIVLVLALALRAVLLPVIATAFSLLVTAAAFGLLQMLFGGSSPPLSGPGYLDPITVISVFTVAFAISVAFSTILLMRTREEYVGSNGSDGAVRRGLRDTAAASTGAGLLMVAALIPFSLTDLLNIRALGIGVAFAVLLDVLVVRPVLLPAAEKVVGRFGWWPTTAARKPAQPPATRRHHRIPRLPHRHARPAHE